MSQFSAANVIMANAGKSSRVSFGKVTVYEFSSAIGTHTGVRDGIPIRLDRLLRQTTMSLEARAPRPPLARLSRTQRVRRLYDYGINEKEIGAAEAAIVHEHMVNTALEILHFYEERKESSLKRGLLRVLDKKHWKKISGTKKRSTSPTHVLKPPVPAAAVLMRETAEVFF